MINRVLVREVHKRAKKLIIAGQEMIWKEKMRAFIEPERALNLKMMTTKKNTANET